MASAMADRPHFDAATIPRWRKAPISFVEEVLHDPETGKPYVLLPAERAFLAHAFQMDADGRLLYPEQIYSCPKKSGKTAFAAMHTLVTVLLFGGTYPEAAICANDLEQSIGRVFEAIRRIIESSPLLRSEAKVTADRITFPVIGATITALASDYAGAAGANPVISVFDELWGYTSERSRRLWDEMVPPPTRKVACRLTVTYAGFSGESVLLEEMYKRGMALPEVGPSLRAGDGLLMFWSHELVAPWQTAAWLAQMRSSLRPNAFLRMIENRFVTSESTFIDMAWWDNCVDVNASPVVSDRMLSVFVGVDASVKHDSTAIVAVAWDRKLKKARLIWHRIYQPSADEPLDFERTVEETLLDLHKRFRVKKVLYDPYQMAAVSQRLVRAGVKMEEFPQTVPNLTQASQNLYELIQGSNLIVYPNEALRLAVSRAVAVETGRGWRISKDKQSHKIDCVVALAQAALSATKEPDISFYSGHTWVTGNRGRDEPPPRWTNGDMLNRAFGAGR
jgi:phage terminase large subunit-like protein